MPFALKLFWRLSLASALSLVVALAWIAWSTNRFLQDDIAASADRVASVILDRERFGAGDPHPIVVTPILQAMTPGICVDVTGPAFPDTTRLCSGWGDTGLAEPKWFSTLVNAWSDDTKSVSRAIMSGGRQDGIVVASADPVIIVRRAWAHFKTIAYAAIAMTILTTIVSALVVAHTLLPAKALVAALQKLGREDYAARVPKLGEPAFQRFADAFNHLADNLEGAQKARVALSRQLFRVQEDERLKLARELHDEFGQCLTSAGALAASIESGISGIDEDLATEAHLIGDVVARMKTTLRSALEELRPPELDELGLSESLQALVASWRQKAAGTRFELVVADPLPLVDRERALAIYRTVQEGLTNAVRHGIPTSVHVEVSPTTSLQAGVVVAIRDNGHADNPRALQKGGLGILGMRERISALGGELVATRLDAGFLVRASVPLEMIDGSV